MSTIKIVWTKGIDNKWHKTMENLDFEDGWNPSYSIIDFESSIGSIKIAFVFNWEEVDSILKSNEPLKKHNIKS